MANQLQNLGRYQFSLLSMIIGTTFFAVFLSYSSVVGFYNSTISLGESFIISNIIYIICVISTCIRKRICFFRIVIYGILGTISAGFLCYFINNLNPHNIDLFELSISTINETRIFKKWLYWGMLIGPVVGVVHCLISYHPFVEEDIQISSE
jgi:hypothetical protein